MLEPTNDQEVEMEAQGKPEGRPMAEIRAIVAADNARFDELAEVWGELTEAEQIELVALAKAKAREGRRF